MRTRTLILATLAVVGCANSASDEYEPPDPEWDRPVFPARDLSLAQVLDGIYAKRESDNRILIQKIEILQTNVVPWRSLERKEARAIGISETGDSFAIVANRLCTSEIDMVRGGGQHVDWFILPGGRLAAYDHMEFHWNCAASIAYRPAVAEQIEVEHKLLQVVEEKFPASQHRGAMIYERGVKLAGVGRVEDAQKMLALGDELLDHTTYDKIFRREGGAGSNITRSTDREIGRQLLVRAIQDAKAGYLAPVDTSPAADPAAELESVREDAARRDRERRGRWESKQQDRLYTLSMGEWRVVNEVERRRGPREDEIWVTFEAMQRARAEQHEPGHVGARPPMHASSPEAGGRSRALPSADEIVAMDADAEAFALAALSNPRDKAMLAHVFDARVVPALLERNLVQDPQAMRAAVQSGFSQIGYPRSSRGGYLAALEALGPPPSSQVTDGSELKRVTERFDTATTVQEFGDAFSALRSATKEGSVPLAPDPEFVAAVVDAAVRVMKPHEDSMRAAAHRRGVASRAVDEARGEIEQAERDVIDGNAAIHLANDALGAAEARQRVAVASRNAAVTRLNESTSEIRDAERAAESPGAAMELQAVLVAAKQSHAALEAELSAEVEALGIEAQLKGEAADAAAQEATDQLARAAHAEARARAAAAREDAAAGEYNDAVAAEWRVRGKIAGVLGALVRSFDFVGQSGDPTAAGDSARSRNARLAALATLLELAHEEEPIVAFLPAIEREAESTDPQLRALGTMALSVEADRRKRLGTTGGRIPKQASAEQAMSQ